MFSNPKKNVEQFDISPGQKIADFGSGAGYYTFLAAEMVGETGRVYAIDIHKDQLVTLKREADKAHLFNIDVVLADLEVSGGTKLKEKVIDRGFVANVLFQITHKASFVKEISRVLRPGGKILVVDWTDSFGGIGPRSEDVFLKEKCRELFEQHGFELEKEISAGVHHYGFVFKKV